jgi:hypothetical protein
LEAAAEDIGDQSHDPSPRRHDGRHRRSAESGGRGQTFERACGLLD